MNRPSRWTFATIGGALFALGGVTAGLTAGAQTKPVEVVVYKSPSCGCCTKWVDHIKAAGFRVTIHDQDDLTTLKADAGVPSSLGSCHTAIVAGKYAIEGHVPAATIKRLLKEKPKVLGLSVPGMVSGTPGMEGGRVDPYDVVAFDAQGKHTVYEKH